ncbi:hypothetical protein HY469_02555 [Candidatus Roizmanbacteria bacterium]|nr:hypothetical protein [Candidatus Roizmanbacteria bacterium]
MKRYFSAGLFIIPICVLVFYSTPVAFATEHPPATESEIAQENTMEEQNATDSATIEYILAYPGMLPGHPFYKLKVARDKMQAFLISSPSKKVQFYLRQADKGMFATLLLAEQRKQDLTTETALKAEHNMTLVNTYLKQHNEKPDEEVFEMLTIASMKHKETLESAWTHLDEEHQKTMDQVLNFVQINLDSINRLKSIPTDRWNTDK